MKRILCGTLFLGLFLAGCIFGPGADRSELILAHVDSKTISAAQLDSIAADKGIIIKDTTNVEALKMELLDSLIDLRVIEIRQDSVSASLENEIDFVEKRTNELSNAVFRMMFEGEITNKTTVDSAEITLHYQQNTDRYKSPEEVKASHILIPPPPPDTNEVVSREKVAEIMDQNDKETMVRAEAILVKAKQGENWDSLAVKYSQDATNNKKGGDLGYFRRGKMVPAFDSAAFASEINDIIGPIKTRFGYHIIKIVDHKTEQVRELDEELYSDIEKELKRTKEKERADSYLDSLKAEAKYTYNEEALGQPDSLLEDDLWVLVVNDVDTVYENRVKRDFPKYLRHYRIADTAWTAETKKDMLKDISVTFLLRSAARILGYFEKPKAIEIKEEFNRREARTRTKNLLRNLEYKPSEEEMKQYYQDKFDELYKEKKPLHIQHIIFEDSVLALAIRDSLAAGANFKETALKYYPGEPEIREVAYDLGFISEKELGKEFFDYIMTLEVKSISMPFRTEWGYHVVKLVDKREDKRLDLVRPGIKKALMEAADAKIRKQYIDQRRSEVVITIEEGSLKDYEFPESLHSVEITPKG
ncbi:MAG: hypothetical protein GY839_20760 [candidate division Zixibacteria bacterium]|nr:hypothetical protein [candidate division Zixibacteria bacterium]